MKKAYYILFFIAIALTFSFIPYCIVQAVESGPRMWIETPNTYYSADKSFTVSGWALNSAGVKEAIVKIDGQSFGKASVEQNRSDVNKIFVGYPTAWSFAFEVDINKVPQGNHNLSVEITAMNDSKTEQIINIFVDKPIPKMWIESPISSIKLTQDLPCTTICGWALNASGIKQVNILIDGEKKTSIGVQNNRSDVNEIYKGYPTGSSFMYNLDINNILWGQHILSVEAVGNDGSKSSQNINVVVEKPEPMMWIENPGNGIKLKNNTSLSGWVVSSSLISSIDISIDGVKKGQGTITGPRPDVNAVVKGYPTANGFLGQLDLSSEKQGIHTVAVEIKFSDGSRKTQSVQIVKNIVYAIDIGHNTPYDGGAVGLRREDDLTKEVGLRVIDKLSKSGYEVVNVLPKTAISEKDSLQQRVDKANAANVDYFVSIHFNVYNGAAKGTEVYALSEEARKMAQKVVDNIAALGYTNRGVKSNDFFVLVNTKAPAMLIECFFVDNAEDVSRYNPDALADAIVRGIMK